MKDAILQPELGGMPAPELQDKKPVAYSFVGFKLTPEKREILERRAHNHPGGLSGYIRDKLDLTRNHHGRKAVD